MRQTERYKAARDPWLNLVRAACLTQVSGSPSAITVSRRFALEVTAFEVGQFGRTAQHVVEEYGLFSETTQEGNSLSIRVTREQEAPSSQKVQDGRTGELSTKEPTASEPIAQPSSSSIRRLLHLRRAVRTEVKR